MPVKVSHKFDRVFPRGGARKPSTVLAVRTPELALLEISDLAARLLFWAADLSGHAQDFDRIRIILSSIEQEMLVAADQSSNHDGPLLGTDAPQG